MKQPGMFDETAADLPIFSGTCLRADKTVFKPPVTPDEETITCDTCRDTGELGGRPCLCRLAGLQEVTNA